MKSTNGREIHIPFLRTPYNYDTEAASDESGLMCLDPSLAQQNMADECDINTIVKRFNLTGQLPDNFTMPRYGDFLDVSDYHSALNQVKAADAAFMSLPADLRAKFGNDPGALVEFLSDESNRSQAIELGLLHGDSRGGPEGGAAGPGDGGGAPMETGVEKGGNTA